MPRPLRRVGAPAPPRDTTMTTPTRPTATNAITAAIPPFMLETPPHAPFQTTPVPAGNTAPRPARQTAPAPQRTTRPPREQQQTPTANGNGSDNILNQSQASSHALASSFSQQGPNGEESLLESAHHDAEDAKQLVGLRDISSLATWTLSSAKPGCALQQLRHPSPAHFWQSDGPQPHTLTLHFFKLVAIVKMRIYLDFELDESYTPTKMKFYAGMSEGGLVEFGSWETQETTDPETGEVHSTVEGVRGWIEVPLEGVGGRESKLHESYGNCDRRDPLTNLDHMQVDDDSYSGTTARYSGDVLKAMVVQVRVCENHQNGKDTHVRGFQVFARDEAGMKDMRQVVKKGKTKKAGSVAESQDITDVVGLQPADWMGDPEIR